MPFGKTKSDDAKQLGFTSVTINAEQAKECGFKWNEEYDKNGKKYVLQAPNKETLAMLIDPSTLKSVSGFQISRQAVIDTQLVEYNEPF